MKINCIVTVLSGWLLFCSVSCHLFYPSPQALPKISTVTAEENRVPLSFFRDVPIIKVMVNGKGPYRFILDMTFPISIISSRISEELMLKDGSIKGSDFFLDLGHVKFKQIESLKVGQNEFKEFDCIELLSKPYILGFHHGMLGRCVFADALVTLNYPERTLTIKEGNLSPEDPDTIPISFSRSHKCIVFEGRLNGDDQLFGLIPGIGNLGLYLDDTTRQEVTYLKSPRPYSANFGLEKKYRGQMNGCIEIGKHTINNPMAVHSEAVFKTDHLVLSTRKLNYPVIGGLLLEHFELAIDQRNQLMRLRRLHSKPIRLR